MTNTKALSHTYNTNSNCLSIMKCFFNTKQFSFQSLDKFADSSGEKKNCLIVRLA